MKTRILTTALMIIATTGIIASPVQSESEDSLYNPHLAVVNETNIMATVEFESNPAYLPVALVELNNAGLEDWVESRESWESEASFSMISENMDAVNLEGWFDSRENWEQNDSETTSLPVSLTTVELEQWIGDRTSWEQESSAYDLTVEAYINNLDEWVSERETWEQK